MGSNWKMDVKKHNKSFAPMVCGICGLLHSSAGVTIRIKDGDKVVIDDICINCTEVGPKHAANRVMWRAGRIQKEAQKVIELSHSLREMTKREWITVDKIEFLTD